MKPFGSTILATTDDSLMERVATIFVHSGDKDDKEIAKRIINKSVLEETHSLVAWYPDLGDDGLQGVFVTDCSYEDIMAAFGKRWMALATLDIKCDYKVQEIKPGKVN